MKRVVLLAMLSVVVLIAGSGLAASPAAANFGSQGTCGVDVGQSNADPNRSCVSLANNRTHAVRPLALGDFPGMDAATTWTLANVYDPTNLVAYTTTTDSVPDVWAQDGFYGNNGTYGWVDCPAAPVATGSYGTSLRWCRGQDLRFNASMSGDITTTTGRRGLACHEMGHTLGLRHTTASTSCMATADINFPPITTIDSHDRDHLLFYG